jgi:lipoate-protein ligase B
MGRRFRDKPSCAAETIEVSTELSKVDDKYCEFEIRDCGLMPYTEALELQQQLCLQRQEDKIHNTVLLVEHEPVITLGARKSENKLIVSEKILNEKGIEVVKVGRGGGTTAHNPGQLVIYPIVKLRSLQLGVNEYIRMLEETGIELLAQYGIECGRRKGFPGLWVGEKKIGSIGVQIKRWVTFHGMAINIKNDLSIFDNIVPCGIEKVVMTSLSKEMDSQVTMKDVKNRVSKLSLCRLTLKAQKE